jgi:uncharacterized protein (TIGR03435 family)
MIREMLVDQFGLTLHRVDGELPVYTIGVDAAGARMAEADPRGPDDLDFNGIGKMPARAMNMDDLAAVLEQVVLDRPDGTLRLLPGLGSG